MSSYRQTQGVVDATKGFFGTECDLAAVWSPQSGLRKRPNRADLQETYFAWSRPTNHEPRKNGTSYYRIQGPRLVAEFSPQAVGGDPTMHVRTINRDPGNDYGVNLTGAQ
jgi:hypothetical protein